MQNPAPGLSRNIYSISRALRLTYNKTWCLIAKLFFFLFFLSSNIEWFSLLPFSLSLSFSLILFLSSHPRQNQFLKIKRGDRTISIFRQSARNFYVDVIFCSSIKATFLAYSIRTLTLCTTDTRPQRLNRDRFPQRFSNDY